MKNKLYKYMARKKIEKKQDVLGKKFTNEQVLAALSYIWILCLIPLLSKRTKFVDFHARQGLVLFILEMGGMMVFWFPLIGQILPFVLFVVSALAVVRVLNGEKWEIPGVYMLSKKLNF